MTTVVEFFVWLPSVLMIPLVWIWQRVAEASAWLWTAVAAVALGGIWAAVRNARRRAGD